MMMTTRRKTHDEQQQMTHIFVGHQLITFSLADSDAQATT
jgi:hypothetical protein